MHYPVFYLGEPLLELIRTVYISHICVSNEDGIGIYRFWETCRLSAQEVFLAVGVEHFALRQRAVLVHIEYIERPPTGIIRPKNWNDYSTSRVCKT